ncbi:hypothetical protein BDD12DRAFT_906452 [Trichophaea hybrida]|nr:hypothetical protein BDD12DRAFT_906452 [Trichophaea hybrida]
MRLNLSLYLTNGALAGALSQGPAHPHGVDKDFSKAAYQNHTSILTGRCRTITNGTMGTRLNSSQAASLDIGEYTGNNCDGVAVVHKNVRDPGWLWSSQINHSLYVNFEIDLARYRNCHDDLRRYVYAPYPGGGCAHNLPVYTVMRFWGQLNDSIRIKILITVY